MQKNNFQKIHLIKVNGLIVGNYSIEIFIVKKKWFANYTNEI